MGFVTAKEFRLDRLESCLWIPGDLSEKTTFLSKAVIVSLDNAAAQNKDLHNIILKFPD